MAPVVFPVALSWLLELLYPGVRDKGVFCFPLAEVIRNMIEA